MQAMKKKIYHWISQHFMDGCSSYNDLAVRRRCRSKEQARAVFAQAKVPHAKGLIFLNPLKAHQFAKQYGFPLVIKPNVSGFSRGSYFPINSYGQLWKAIFLAKLWWPTTVVEQYLLGKNYRVVVVKGSDNHQGELMSVIERFSPYVQGDGLQTIDQLIDEENGVRKTMGLFPVIHPLSKGKVTQRFLAKYAYSLATVPKKGEIVPLFYRISLAPGGVVSIIDQQSIPQVNKDLFTDVLAMFDANILGIDVIMAQGINTPYDQQDCILLEVNSRPYLKMHDYPRFGQKEDLSRYFSHLDQFEINQADVF
ncbi:MAG: cyanophycin synthetase [Oleispira sp.]|jgi:D-alanine-D-alanine ligase-like ATP-grasp enzyme|nr:cyanophycin synthetase [Oleispira sp.]